MVPEVSDTEFRAKWIFAMRRENGVPVIPLAAGKPTPEKPIPRCANNFLPGMAGRDMIRHLEVRRTGTFARSTERQNEKYRGQQTGFKQC